MTLSTPRRAMVATAATLLPLAAVAVVATTATSASAVTNLLTNPGFESGSTTGWSCSSADKVVTSPVHSGSYALAAGATSSDDAQCTQTLTLSANTTYTLSGEVEGAYAYLGVSGGAAADDWTPSATSWQQLSTTFTTGSSTSVTVYVHGWYAQGTDYFDDMSLVTGSSAPPPPTTTTTPPPTTTSGGGGGTGTGSGDYAFAPYVDMSNNQEPMLATAVSSTGLKAFTTAFVIGSGCTPIWGDTLPVTNDPTIDGEISSAEAGGASPIISFGGASGVELASSCTTLSSLESAYQSVITTLGVNHIDFDIEGAELAYTATNNLRFQAIKELESANPGLVVSVTLPVLPTGLTSDGTTFLAAAKSYGVTLGVINVMTMDYGASFDSGINMATAAEQAAAATLAQARADWPSDTYANIGVTPMIGVNDDSAEVFSLANASALVSWAKSNGIGRLAFWSVDRDQQCGGSATGLPQCSEISQSPLAFTKIFEAF